MSAGAGRRSDPKGEAADAIARAQAELERAVEELARLPAVDLHSIALAAHALNNFLTVSGGVVAHLIPALRGHPDRQISVWLEGLAHATDLRFEYRHEWRIGDVVIWDNRCLLHKAKGDYPVAQVRYLYRLMLRGEKPV